MNVFGICPSHRSRRPRRARRTLVVQAVAAVRSAQGEMRFPAPLGRDRHSHRPLPIMGDRGRIPQRRDPDITPTLPPHLRGPIIIQAAEVTLESWLRSAQGRIRLSPVASATATGPWTAAHGGVSPAAGWPAPCGALPAASSRSEGRPRTPRRPAGFRPAGRRQITVRKRLRSASRGD